MPSPGKLKILHVDDDPVSLFVLDQALRAFGHDPLAVCSPLEALQALQIEQFDVVITDLHMPQMDGQALLQAVRTRERGAPPTPVIAVSADVLTYRPGEYLDLGFAGFVAKPLMFGPLQALLEQVTAARAAPPHRDPPAAQATAAASSWPGRR